MHLICISHIHKAPAINKDINTTKLCVLVMQCKSTLLKIFKGKGVFFIPHSGGLNQSFLLKFWFQQWSGWMFYTTALKHLHKFWNWPYVHSVEKLSLFPWIFWAVYFMMASSNGNIFRVNGPLCGELPGEFPSQRPVTWSFDVFFDLCLNNRWSKQLWGWWFETTSHSLWRHCNVGINLFSKPIISYDDYITHN